VFHAAGQQLTMESFPIPLLRGGEAVARIRCATICGSDLHSFFGRRPAPTPSVLGHEMVAEIVGVGPGGISDYRGRPLALGDRVTWSMVWSCGECFYCQRGLRPKCERLMKFGHEKMAPGRELLGGLAEHCYLPERTAIFQLPANLPDAVACPANCATATVAAVFRNAGVCDGQTVVVHGAGTLGLTACAMAAQQGASQVVLLEPNEARRKMAPRFGATTVLDSAQPTDEIREQILRLTHRRGADTGMEFSGFPEAVELGVQLLRDGGRFVMAGATFPSRPVQLPAEQLVRRLLHVIGVYNYQPEDLEDALNFLSQSQGRYPFEQLVGKSFPLDDANAALDYAERQRPPRVAVIPQAAP
jgi:alcohol dehydrogenase